MNRILFLILFICSFQSYGQKDSLPDDPNLMTFQLDSLVAALEPTGKPWLPFIKGKNVLTGLYNLKAGAEDRQRPHDTDEVYYVVSGNGKFKAGGEEITFQAGSILFVKAQVEHRFFDISEDAVLLVFFDQ